MIEGKIKALLSFFESRFELLIFIALLLQLSDLIVVLSIKILISLSNNSGDILVLIFLVYSKRRCGMIY